MTAYLIRRGIFGAILVFLSTVVDNGDPNGEILPVLEREPAKRGRKAKEVEPVGAEEVTSGF